MLSLHSYDENVLHFHAVDEHAKRAKDSDSVSYDSLVAYLRRPFGNNDTNNKELLLARALVVWVCHVQSQDVSGAAFDTPRGLVQQMKNKMVDNARVFKMLCGYAGIECEMVTGRAKAIRYQAGDADSGYIQGHTWNAFKAGHQWHLLHPQWCVHAYVGYVHGGESRLEKDGQHEVKQTVQKDGVSMYMLNDFWFCTNPEIFVTRCFPDDPQWQCLSKDKLVKSVSDFLNLPDLRQGFYRQKLTLVQHKSCVIQAPKGKCNISILAPKDSGQDLRFSYELLATNVSNIDVNNIPLLVFFIPNSPPDSFKFEIGFPAVGIYRLKLRIGMKGQNTPLMNCCEFKIDCKAADPQCRKLPVDTGIQGWGFGPDAKAAGLKNPSTSGGKIHLPPAGKAKGGKMAPLMEVRLDTDAVNDNEYTADIYRASDSPSTSTEKAVVDIDRNTRKMRVHAQKLDKLENSSALVIKCKRKNDKASKATPVANFVLTSEKESDSKKEDEALTKAVKQTRNQEKMNRALEKNKLLKTERETKRLEYEEMMKRLADNESCD